MDELIKLAAYVPEIAIGIIIMWFTLEVFKRVSAMLDKLTKASNVQQEKFLAALEKRDADTAERNTVVVQALNNLCASTKEHDSYVRVKLDSIEKAFTPTAWHNGDDDRRRQSGRMT